MAATSQKIIAVGISWKKMKAILTEFSVEFIPWWVHSWWNIIVLTHFNTLIPRQNGRYLPDNTFNTLRPRQNGRHFADDTFKRIFLNENVWISIKISLKFVPEGPINDIPELVQIMAWRRPGDKPLSEPMMDSLPTRIYVTRPQWFKRILLIENVWIVIKFHWSLFLRVQLAISHHWFR